MILIFILIILIVIGVYVYSFNKLNSLNQHVTESWSDIDVQLKRRQDLIPNLIKVVQGYAAHEKNLMEELTLMRTKALTVDKDNLKEKASVEENLGDKTKSLLAVAENYPDLKANTEFLNLQKELSETEDEIASSRRIYNSNVAEYNTAVSTVPTNLIASLHHFTPKDFFQKD